MFRTQEHDAIPSHCESLQLDSAAQGLHRLTRTLTLGDGVQATLVTEGPDPGALLERVDAVPHDRQLRHGNGFVVALSHRLLDTGALLFTKAGLPQDSVIRMPIFNAPPLLLVAFFCMREPPRIEWPSARRRSTSTVWRSAADA